MIAIVDYGMGNLRSVFNALAHLGYEACITDNAAEILEADKVVLPGVGSFRYAMNNIRLKRLDDVLKRASDSGTPLLGICLGMQLLMDWGLEDGRTEGLGFIPGHVEQLPELPDCKIPHIGFNRTLFVANSESASMFKGLDPGANFYFVHGYRVCCDERAHIAAETEYGETFTSAIQREHVYGVQFHPEKSRRNGLAVLKNFASL